MKKILDVGCGTGEFLNSLKTKNDQLWGIDISKKNIKKANSLFKNNANFSVSPAEKLNFEDESFDEIYFLEVLEHVDNLYKVIDEIRRVLKKGGKLTISVPLKESEEALIKLNPSYPSEIGHKRFFGKKDFLNLFKDGFKILNYKKYNAIETFYWKKIFKSGIKIKDSNAKLSKKENILLKIIKELFNQDNFFVYKRKNELIYFSKLIFLPFSKILDKIYLNKKQQITLVKSK